MTNAPTLRDIAQAILDKHGVSGREVQRIAEKSGLTIAHTTINAMASGSYTSRPSDKTLRALVELSDFTLEQVYAAARRPVPRSGLRERLPEDADALTGEQEEAVLAVVRQFVKANRALHDATTEGGEHGGDTAPTSPAGDQPATVTDLAHRQAGPSPEALDPTMPVDVAARSGRHGHGSAQAERDRQDEEGETP